MNYLVGNMKTLRIYELKLSKKFDISTLTSLAPPKGLRGFKRPANIKLKKNTFLIKIRFIL